MIQLIPVYDLRAIDNKWRHFVDGFEELSKTKYNAGDININQIYNDLMAGHLLIWTAFIDKVYQGFITTKVIAIPFGDRHMLIEHIYAKDGHVHPELYKDGMVILMKHAKDMGCARMKFMTKRDKAFEKVMKPTGWNPEQTVFYKEVV